MMFPAPYGFFLALMVCVLPGLAAAPASVKPLSLSQLEQRLAEINSELTHLPHYSLRSGVGPISYRSKPHPDANHLEWVQIALGKTTPIDEVVLVPAIWRDMTTGFRADGTSPHPSHRWRQLLRHNPAPSGVDGAARQAA